MKLDFKVGCRPEEDKRRQECRSSDRGHKKCKCIGIEGDISRRAVSHHDCKVISTFEKAIETRDADVALDRPSVLMLDSIEVLAFPIGVAIKEGVTRRAVAGNLCAQEIARHGFTSKRRTTGPKVGSPLERLSRSHP